MFAERCRTLAGLSVCILPIVACTNDFFNQTAHTCAFREGSHTLEKWFLCNHTMLLLSFGREKELIDFNMKHSFCV